MSTSALRERSIEAELRSRTDRHRIVQLDALRGLAALAVVLQHVRSATILSRAPWYVVLFTAGKQAVCLFFVLSGFVLSAPFLHGTAGSYLSYLLRRLARVYLPYAAAVLLAFGGAWTFRNAHTVLSPWFAQTWHTPLSGRLLLQQLSMDPTPDLNTAFWSLRYEVILSVLMPLLVWVMQRLSSPVVIGALGFLGFKHDAYMLRLDKQSYLGTTIQVAALFAVGVWLAQTQGRWKDLLSRRRRTAWLLLIASILLFYGFPLWLSTPTHNWIDTNRAWAVYGLGAAGIILCALALPPFQRALRQPFPEYLGEISYSLYLVHSVVLFALFDLLTGRLPLLLIQALVVLTSIASAHLFWRLIEKPCIQLSKSLKRLARSPRGKPVV